jgi:hypothetical protein
VTRHHEDDNLTEAVEQFVAAGVKFAAGCAALTAGARAAAGQLSDVVRRHLEQVKKKAGGGGGR